MFLCLSADMGLGETQIMSNELRKAVMEFKAHLNRTAGLAPHMPSDLVNDLAALHKLVHRAAEAAKSLHVKANKTWGDIETKYYDMQKTFVAAGNHPDDYDNTEEGRQVQSAMDWSEQVTGTLNPRDSGPMAVSHSLVEADESLERYLKWAKTGIWR